MATQVIKALGVDTAQPMSTAQADALKEELAAVKAELAALKVPSTNSPLQRGPLIARKVYNE